MFEHGVLLSAILLELAIGYPPALFLRIRHPVVWMGRLLNLLEKILYRTDHPFRQGVFVMILYLSAVAAISLLIVRFNIPALEAVCIAALSATRNLYTHVQDVVRGLQNGIEQGRAAVAKIVGRDVSASDQAGVSRAAIESLAESFCDGVVAPLLAAWIGGLPGIAIYKAINTADSMIGHKNERYRKFGTAAARLDDLVNFIPARISAFLIMLASGRRMLTVYKIIRRDGGLHDSPNAGRPEAAMAGALGVKLAGPVIYEGETHSAAFIGDGVAEVNVTHIKQALRIYATACALMVLPLVWFWLN